jgi:hypothetical protein
VKDTGQAVIRMMLQPTVTLRPGRKDMRGASTECTRRRDRQETPRASRAPQTLSDEPDINHADALRTPYFAHPDGQVFRQF